MTPAAREPKNVEDGGAGRRGDDRCRDVFRANPTCFIIDARGSIRVVTAFGAAQLGYETEELAGRPFADLVFADDRQLVLQNMAACLDAIGRPLSWEARQISRDKGVLRVRHHAEAMRWASSEFVVLLGCENVAPGQGHGQGQDLELERLVAIAASPDEAIVSNTLEDTITSWNAGACQIFGYQASDMIGHSSLDIIPPERRDEEREILARLQGGERLRHYETVRVAKDGRRVDVSLTVLPLVDLAGKVVGVSKVARDITDAKSAARGLRGSAARVAAVIETAGDGVILIDGRGTVLVFNAVCEGLFGYPAGDVIGRNVKMLMPEPYRRNHDRYISDYLATHQPKIIGNRRELVGRHKDGSTFPLSLSVGEASQESDSIFVGIIHDLTAAKRAEAELQQVRTELARVARLTTLGELTAAIAHEVNQPLTGLVSSGNACLRWLGQEMPDLEAARQSVHRMVSAGNRAVEIIARIRALVGKSSPQHRRLGMNEAIREVIALIHLELERNQIGLETNLANDLPDVWGDRIQLQQVILNLVMNAIEAMSGMNGRARVLSITSAPDGPIGVRVTVSDCGIGLGDASPDRLFEAFYTTKASGMGIGLAVSRTIVEAHGGRLWAVPNQPHGAVFQFTLPANDESSR
ncbi:MAG: PAS domain S-box protein [Alphaproteobacteria bacterium]|nr:PAS domain S-box protein [Alphaproteobacteria bacterium]MBV8407924.1 PAS domain S-box protein [Alphaproteobacteria bacterium]